MTRGSSLTTRAPLQMRSSSGSTRHSPSWNVCTPAAATDFTRCARGSGASGPTRPGTWLPGYRDQSTTCGCRIAPPTRPIRAEKPPQTPRRGSHIRTGSAAQALVSAAGMADMADDLAAMIGAPGGRYSLRSRRPPRHPAQLLIWSRAVIVLVTALAARRRRLPGGAALRDYRQPVRPDISSSPSSTLANPPMRERAHR
jgi:hypothetical protein